MSNRFVSGGVIDSSGDTVSQAPAQDRESGEGSAPEAPKNTEWEAVQKELEAERKRREEQRVKAASGEEKSLYDILQANKEAKQAAFEEQNKIRNQFRALDDDEIDFLDEVREKERKVEEEKRRELEDGLKAFREARQGGAGAKIGDDDGENGEAEGESWEVGGRKRKRKGRDGVVKGVRRKVEDGKGEAEVKEEIRPTSVKEDKTKPITTTNATTDSKSTAGSAAGGKGLGLVGYGSDDSDEE